VAVPWQTGKTSIGSWQKSAAARLDRKSLDPDVRGCRHLDLSSRNIARLEVLPTAYCFHRHDEVDFYEMFFTEVAQIVPLSEALISQVHLEAQSAGLGALDALHVAAAKISGAEEFVTTERSTTPLFRVAGLMMTTIRPTTRF
jgi:hypothetical protein